MVRDPQQFSTRRLQNIERLERQLVGAPDDREGWLRLALVRLQQQRSAEALVAFEYGLWGLPAAEVAQALLESGWPWGEGADDDPAERLFGAALTGGLTAERLRTDEPTLRVRSAWLLWDQIGDDAQRSEARARLAAVPSSAARDLPAFAQDSEAFATWSGEALMRTLAV